MQLISGYVEPDYSNEGNFNWWFQTDGSADFSTASVPETSVYGFFFGAAAVRMPLVRWRHV
jgi:hypothetical protein